uniref:Lipocalin/cytosolic fatty-acid binding domain-containing protein n=1 Tax=Sciurus vulgaris TaxID=55149 RepID=A0A8D2DMD5_SCIVU
MKTLFLSIVLLGLVAALQAQDPLSFPSEELNITGTWYTKAVVFNMTQVPGWKRPSKVVPMRVTALEDGTWEAKTTLLINGRCLEKKITLQKTEEPGRYRGFVLVEELPEQEHYIFYCQDQGPGKTPHMAKLMGEQPRESPSPAHVPLPKLEDTATPWNQALQPLGCKSRVSELREDAGKSPPAQSQDAWQVLSSTSKGQSHRLPHPGSLIYSPLGRPPKTWTVMEAWAGSWPGAAHQVSPQPGEGRTWT